MSTNVNRGLRIYCGNKREIPAGTRRGSPLQCLRKGLMIGKMLERQALGPRLLERQRAAEAATAGIARRQFIQLIQSRGLSALKQELPIGTLNKDELRSIAVRLSGTPDAIVGYSRLSQQQLLDALVQRGFQRTIV